jgi:type VI protein secretion system component VasK
MRPTRDNWVQFLVAAALLVATTFFFVYLVGQVDGASETEWARLAYLFGAVEAVAFTVIGWLFGKEVHREQAATAVEDKQAALSEKDKAEGDLADIRQRAERLAGAVEASTATRQTRTAEGEELLGGAGDAQTIGPRQVAYLRELTAELFPRPGEAVADPGVSRVDPSEVDGGSVVDR